MCGLGDSRTRPGEGGPRRFQRVDAVLGTFAAKWKIERFDVAMLAPSGGDLGGFILARGTASQLDALRRDSEFQEILNRVQMIADRVLINDAYVDEGLGQLIGVYDKVVTEFA